MTTLGLLFSIASTINLAATSAAVVGNDEALESELMAAIPELAAMFVAIAPGKTIVTPTFVASNSDRKPSVSNLIAAFEAP